MHNLSFNLCPLELFLPYVYLLLLCILLLSVSVIRINLWKNFSFSVCWGKTWRSSHSTIAGVQHSHTRPASDGGCQHFDVQMLTLLQNRAESYKGFALSNPESWKGLALSNPESCTGLALGVCSVLVSLFCVFVSLFSASPSFGQNHNVFADQTETNYSSFEIKIIKMVYRLRVFVLSRSLLHTQYFESGSPS